MIHSNVTSRRGGFGSVAAVSTAGMSIMLLYQQIDYLCYNNESKKWHPHLHGEPMERGDVFQDYKDQFYLVDSVAPSGTVYAFKYDLRSGAYGDPLTFDKPYQRPVFNIFKPENDPDMIYCRIEYRCAWFDEWSGEEWFEAFMLEDGAAKTSLGASDKGKFIRSEQVIYQYDREISRQLYHQVAEELASKGWIEVVEHHDPWYGVRFKRPGLYIFKKREVKSQSSFSDFYLDVYDLFSGQQLYSLTLPYLPYGGGASVSSQCYLSKDQRFLRVTATRYFMGDRDHDRSLLYELPSGKFLLENEDMYFEDISVNEDTTLAYVLLYNQYYDENKHICCATQVYRLSSQELVEDRHDDGALYQTGSRVCLHIDPILVIVTPQ